MKTFTPSRWAAGLLIAVPTLFLLFFTLLSIVFDYPAILRRPAAEILTRFAAGGPGLIALWYGLAFSSFLLIPASLLVHRAQLSATKGTSLLVLGVLAGVFQMLGLLRWSFLVPVLAQSYLGSPETAQQTVIVFQAFHQFFGVAIGEHLGYLTTALWTGVLVAAMREAKVVGKSMGFAGIVLAIGITFGLAEPLAGWAGVVNALAYSLWAPWLAIVGVLWFRRELAG